MTPHSDSNRLADAYAGLSFEPIPSSGRPGTPHCYFRESYRVVVAQNDRDDDSQLQHCKHYPIIHQHANGVCVLVLDPYYYLKEEKDTNTDCTVTAIQIHINENKQQTLSVSAAKRRRNEPKGVPSKTDGMVQPHNILATVVFNDNGNVQQQHQVNCGIWGTVLEVNDRLTAELWNKDPLLEGYLAIVLPKGPFPPPLLQVKQVDLPTLNRNDVIRGGPES